MSQTPLVIKIGGALLENSAALDAFFATLAAHASSTGQPLVLVHGGGCMVEQWLKQLGFVSEKKKGLRVTPLEQIPYVAGALAGTANKQLMGKALQAGLKAVGLSLGDGNSTRVSQMDAELGAVGVCQPADPTLLKQLLAGGFLPVVSSIGIGADAALYNVNADQAATAICELLGADLAMLSDVEGILDGDKQLISQIDGRRAAQLIEQGIIREGMEVKVNAALQAAGTLKRPVTVASWQAQHLAGLLAGKPVGTQVSA